MEKHKFYLEWWDMGGAHRNPGFEVAQFHHWPDSRLVVFLRKLKQYKSTIHFTFLKDLTDGKVLLNRT